MSKLYQCILLTLIILLVISLDQFSKFWVLGLLENKSAFYILPFLNFILVKNYGVSFGTFNDPAQSQLLLILVSLVVILVLLVWFTKNKSEKIFIPIAMVIGGATGNIIDRVIHGAVVDFIDVKILNWHYPTFNIADAFICVGVFLLVLWPVPTINQKQ